MYVVEAMNGPLDGKRWPFRREIKIGRDADLAQAALATDRAVSRLHAEIRAGGDTLELRDLASKNGTLIDGVLIVEPTCLEVGKPFVVGRTMLRVLQAGDVSSAETE